jgi:CheY-like chemotaxis protein
MTNILMVDDSPMMRRFLAMSLASEGYDIKEAQGGVEAIEMISTTPPDCMLLDLLMPDLSGLEVLATLKEQKVRFPVIVMTADVQESTQKKCFELGAFRVLNKPPKGDELTCAIREALGSGGSS